MHGPFLFLAYTNDLPERVKSRVRFFADDTDVYLIIRSTTESQVIQTGIACLEQWENIWDMLYNPSKAIFFSFLFSFFFFWWGGGGLGIVGLVNCSFNIDCLYGCGYGEISSMYSGPRCSVTERTMIETIVTIMQAFVRPTGARAHAHNS